MSFTQVPLCLRNLLLLDVRANTQTLDTVHMVKVVFQVELVDVERHDELYEIGREVGCPHHGDGKVRPRNVRSSYGRGESARKGTYKKTFLVPNLIIVAVRGRGSCFGGMLRLWRRLDSRVWGVSRLV